MKQTAAILLLLLLLFTITGYRLTVQWMQQNQNTVLEQQLDNEEYDDAALIELSVPLSLPYYNNWRDFERCDGEININGTTYKYVKRKVQDGRLIVKCLPNSQQQVIQKNVSDLFAQVNGIPQQESSSTGLKKMTKAGLFEYEEINSISVSKPTFLQNNFHLGDKVDLLPSGTYSLPWQPPKNIV